MHPVVAIDGPSGAGKGTIARAVAGELGWRYVDTGAMYRAVAWEARRRGLSLEERAEDGVAAVATQAEIDLQPDRVVINGCDVTGAIRTPEIDEAAARVARLPQVRKALVARQQAYAAAGPVVMEGRDIGTVVFPRAAVKIYLDATPAARAARRSSDAAHDLSRAGAIDTVAEALRERDRLDRTRDASPLRKAPDATVVDTTSLPVATVVEQVLGIVRDRLETR
ncbi:MAG: (d)CMP kinase [Acidobacteria bacterium]|nr:(d)CMP kinase [Acidobacteriota bacterium]